MVENTHNEFPSEPVKLTINPHRKANPFLFKPSWFLEFCLKNMCLIAMCDETLHIRPLIS